MRVLLIVCLVALPLITTAQETETWYFGWDETTGEVVSFTASGQFNPLFTAEQVGAFSWRLDDQRALIVASEQNNFGFYQLTTAGAQRLTADFDFNELFLNASKRVASSGNYTVIVSESGTFATGILLDLANNTAQLLSGETIALLDTWRFSADGTRLRYLSRESRESEEWQILERNLASGEETVVHSFVAVFPIVRADATGSRWVYRIFEEETRNMVHFLIAEDGTSQVLAQETLPDPVVSFTNYQFLGNNLMVYNAPCTADCQIELRPVSGGSPTIFTLDAIASADITPIANITPERYLVQIGDSLWFLDSTTKSQQIGFASAAAFSTPVDELLSPDQRWLVVQDSDATFRLIDLANGTIPLNDLSMQRMEVLYTAGGVFITGFEPRRTLFYSTVDNTVYDLPHGSTDFYFAATPSGEVLIALPIGGDVNGVFRFSPADGNLQLVVEGIFPFQLR